MGFSCFSRFPDYVFVWATFFKPPPPIFFLLREFLWGSLNMGFSCFYLGFICEFCFLEVYVFFGVTLFFDHPTYVFVFLFHEGFPIFFDGFHL